MERMAVPQPTSSTILSLKRCLFCTIAFMYDRVRTSSFYLGSAFVCAEKGSIAAGTHQHFFVNALRQRLVARTFIFGSHIDLAHTMVIITICDQYLHGLRLQSKVEHTC